MKLKRTYMKKLLYFFLVFLGVQLNAQDPPDISLIFYLDENVENGTLVGTVTATDPDGDPLTYSIISGNDLGAFAMNSSSGDLTVANEGHLNFDVNPVFSLMVEASDGNGGMTSVEITINLNDIPLGIDDTQQLTIYPNPVSEVLYVELKEAKSNDLNIALYSMGGLQLPIQWQFISNSKVEMDLRSLDRGLYLLRVGSGKAPTTSSRIFVR